MILPRYRWTLSQTGRHQDSLLHSPRHPPRTLLLDLHRPDLHRPDLRLRDPAHLALALHRRALVRLDSLHSHLLHSHLLRTHPLHTLHHRSLRDRHLQSRSYQGLQGPRLRKLLPTAPQVFREVRLLFLLLESHPVGHLAYAVAGRA